MHACMYICMHMCVCVCVCVCIYIYIYTHSGDVEASKNDPSAFERALELACSRRASTSTSAVSMPHIGPVAEDIDRRAPGGEADWGGAEWGGGGLDEEGSSETHELDRQLTEELERLNENIKRHNITVLMFSNVCCIVT